jgi:predicted outer membrane repeat protein
MGSFIFAILDVTMLI